jgi:RNA polymerase sigma factor (sigma-70 family)
VTATRLAPSTGDPDGELVAAALAGDEQAFAHLVERCRAPLQLHCYRMLGSLQDAEDLVQETFLRAWRRLSTFQGRSTFRTWLYRIATNACLDFLDRQQRRPPRHWASPRRAPPSAVAAALPRPAAGAGGRRGRARGDGGLQGDDRAGVPGRHPAPARQAAGGADPAGRARLARRRGGHHPGGERRGGEKRAAASQGDPAGAPAPAAGRVGGRRPAHRPGAGRTGALPRRPRARGCDRAGGAAGRGRPG